MFEKWLIVSFVNFKVALQDMGGDGGAIGLDDATIAMPEEGSTVELPWDVLESEVGSWKPYWEPGTYVRLPYQLQWGNICWCCRGSNLPGQWVGRVKYMHQTYLVPNAIFWPTIFLFRQLHRGEWIERLANSSNIHRCNPGSNGLSLHVFNVL